MRATFFALPLLSIALFGFASAASAQVQIDAQTTLVASFDSSVHPDFSVGAWSANINGVANFVPGKFGKALMLKDRQKLSYDADGKINLTSGTIEFWLLWTADLAEADRAQIAGFNTPQQKDYLNFNKIKKDLLGMPVRQGTTEKFTWQREDIDPTNWKIGSWHYIVGTWDKGTTQLYADGKLAGEKTGGAGFVEEPDEFTIGPGPLVIDNLRISSVARSAESIAAAALATPGAVVSTYLSALTPRASAADVGINMQQRIGGGTLPLVIGDQSYARGVALPAPGFVQFDLPAGFDRLTGKYGISPLGNSSADAQLGFILDGKKVLSIPSVAKSGEINLALNGAHTLRIESHSIDQQSAVAVIGDAMLLTKDAQPPPSFSMTLSADELAIQKIRAGVAAFSFPLPPAPTGYVIYAGHPDDDINPAAAPKALLFPASLSATASPGQYEAVQFTLCAARDLRSVQVEVSDLKATTGTIAQAQVDVSLIGRELERKGYWMPRKPENYDVVSRFLFPNKNFELPAQNFKQVYVLIHVPQNAAPGAYTGTIHVTPQGAPATEMTLNLQVYPIKLVQPTHKRYGVYYHLPTGQGSAEIMDAEFTDMAAHGCTTVVSNVGIQFSKDANAKVIWNFDDFKTLLDMGRKHGFSGEITINDNLPRLAALLGHSGLDSDGKGEAVSDQQDVLDVARRCFADLKVLQQQYPEYQFLLTHMDEVFNPKRIDSYIDFAKVIRKTTDFRIYITLNTSPGWEAYMQKANPYIDVRSYNGHSLESWLQAGHTWNDLAQLLQKSGDEGWIYHNMRGAFFAPKYNRFINGLFMWVSPLKAHVPWMYYSYDGSPFDDTDNDHFDFGYAFPNPENPTQMISTLHWETFREGYDDMRYIVTLQDTIAKAQAKGVDVKAATQWLDHIKSTLPQLPQGIKTIDQEDPYTVAATQHLSGADLDKLRDQTAQYIVQLQTSMNK